MRKVIFYLLTIWLVSSACEGKYPLKIDYEMAEATIIGRETCSTDTSLNAWLVDLGPAQGKVSSYTYGTEATVSGKHYAHVVKTYSPLVSRLDTTKKYIFSFYVENVIPQPNCTFPLTTPINIPQIRVTEAPFKG